jgi:potassium/chloride transporter 9
LFVLGHVLKGDFDELLPEMRRQQLVRVSRSRERLYADRFSVVQAWLKLVDFSRVKAFVDITIADNERAGARSMMLNAGQYGGREKRRSV